MLGGDKYRNDLSDQFIIKCHVCGSTDLRYVGWERIPVGTIHNPGELSYICPNGHQTWGAIDDWSTPGGTDELLQRVEDGCCEGNECFFPRSIKVNIKGIRGVQAREGSNNPLMWDQNSIYADSLGADIGTRVAMPWQMCAEYNTVQFFSGESGVEFEDFIGIGPQSKYRLESFTCGPWHGDRDGITYSGNPDYTNATMWPWRVPTFVNSGIGTKGFSNYQLYYNKDTGRWDGGTAIVPGECGCIDNISRAGPGITFVGGAYTGPTGYVVPPNGEPPYHLPDCTTPDKCLERVTYPPCLNAGIIECADNDAKYRVPCSNPNDNYIINVGSDLPRGVGGKIFGTYGATAARVTRCQWAFGMLHLYTSGIPSSRPSECGDMDFGWSLAPIPEMLNEPVNNYEQPHCVRRVKNANMELVGASYYSVNTDDLSNQTIILDRYYRTYGDIDYLWEGNLAFKTGDPTINDINNYGDTGYNDAVAGRYTPFPWTAHSGSIEEPEIIAIIHSKEGKDGQIAFDTFPVSYDSDVTIDPVYDYFMRPKGSCPFKHKVVVHGFGVKYPLKDDPIWDDDSGIYTYPIFLKGKGYKIGDKIEFRAWRALFDANGNPIDRTDKSAIEHPWNEGTRELTIATATITEVTREGGILYYEFDETDPETGDPLYTIGNNPCPYDLCSNPNFRTGVARADGCNEWDINFNKNTRCEGCASKEIYPSGHEKIDALPMFRASCSLKSWLPGGQWGDAPNLGCISDADHDYATFCTWMNENDKPISGVGTCDTTCTWTRPCDPTIGWNPAAFAVVENADDCVGSTCYCVYNPEIDGPPPDPDGEEGASTMIGPSDLFGIHPPEDDGRQPGIFTGQEYPSICMCGTAGPGMAGDEAVSSYVLPEMNPPSGSGFEADVCWPFNRTWEWVSENYGRSPMKELPIESGIRAYVHPDSPQPYIHPPISPQYRIAWLPRTQQWVDAHDTWYERLRWEVAGSPDKELLIRNAKMDFLRIAGEGCNILNLDLYDRSSKFPQVDFSQKPHKDRPCRVQDYYQGVGTLFVNYSGGECEVEQDIVNDDYCKVYGFYQQVTTPCEVVYKGQYIVRAAQKNWRLGPYADYEAVPARQPLGTSCEPIIDNLTITLRKREARCEISVGAPYNQDILIPEQLPPAYVGPDGGLEAAAHAWPSNIVSDSVFPYPNSKVYNHGLHYPRRQLFQEWKYIPPQAQENNEPYRTYVLPHPEGYESLRQFIPNELNEIKQYLVTPTNQMRDVDGNDLATFVNPETGKTGVIDRWNYGDEPSDDTWDRPDPRANYRVGTSGLELDDYCPNPATENYSEVDITGLTRRNSFQFECVYPWENHVNPVTNPDFDFYCMYKNNSAEIVLNTVEECDICTRQDVLIYHPDNIIRSYVGYDYDFGAHYTIRAKFDEEQVELSDGSVFLNMKYLAFRLYGNLEVIDETLEGLFYELKAFLQLYRRTYLDDVEWENAPDLTKEELEENIIFGKVLFEALSIPEWRELFWNRVFQGGHDEVVRGLTKVVIIGLEETVDPQEGQVVGVPYAEVLYKEERCESHRKTGAIKSMKVINGGSGYAFEVEERVPPVQLAQVLPGYSIKFRTSADDDIDLKYNRRRAETYCFDNDSPLSIDPTPGEEDKRTPYAVGNVIAIGFDDSNARRGGIYYYQVPEIEVTQVDDDGVITDFEIRTGVDGKKRYGEFWKYVGTNQHRAFPVSMVVNNYWNEPGTNDDITKTGKYAVLTPVIGVDPNRDDYGQIKRVDVDFGGIDFVAPDVYWTIHTSAGTYNSEGDMQSGFDLQHLVDPCKFDIQGSGLNAVEVAAIRDWYGINGIEKYVETASAVTIPSGTFDQTGVFSGVNIQFPEALNPQNLNSYYPDGDSYVTSKKYYYKTDGDRVIRWEDRVHGWNTITQAGMCPFGPGGLLDRTYPMALVEEVDITAEQEITPWKPFTGRCTAEQCNELQNMPMIGVTGLYFDEKYLKPAIVSGAWLCSLMPPDPPYKEDDTGTGESGDPIVTGDLIYDTSLPNPWYKVYGGDMYGYGTISDCHWAGCNIYTMYDAHRDSIVYADLSLGFGNPTGSWGSRRRQTMRGCPDEIQVYGDWCDHGFFKRGYVDISGQLAQDDCSNAEYSLYAELAMTWEPVLGPFAVYRAKGITYSMGGTPIEMTVSYNDPTVPVFEPCGTPVCVQTITAYQYITQATHVEPFLNYEQMCARFCGEENGCSCDFECPEGGCSYIITEGECT